MNMMKREKGSSQYKGVMWVNDRGSWRAQIKVNGKCIFLGNFNVEKDAARAYNVAAKQYFREFALLNEGVGDEVPRKQEGDLF